MIAPPSVSIAHHLGVPALILYCVSPLINDLTALSLGGIKLYAGPISYLFMALMAAATGSIFAASQTKIGKLWLFFCAWLVMAIPFSIWPGGSISTVKDFLWRSAVLVLFVPALVTSTPVLSRVIGSVASLSAVILIAICFLHGHADESGRFHVPDSMYYRGANDLAIGLDLIIAGLLYNVLRGRVLVRVFGASLMALCVYYLAKTGSRGAFLGLVVMIVVMFIFSRYRAFILVMAVAGLLMIPLLPQQTLARLTNIVFDPGEKLRQATTADEAANIASQMQRQHLFWKSVEFTVMNPLFGVGPGQFVEALWAKAVETQHHEAVLGTHNTYTQISSESGVVGIVVYVALIVVSIRVAYRVYQVSKNSADFEELSVLAIVLMALLTSYAVNAAFHHLGYSGALALLVGETIALHNVAQPMFLRLMQARVNVPGAALPAAPIHQTTT